MDFLLTFDVESFSIPKNRCDTETAYRVYKEGIPRLLDLCAKHDIPATFFFTGEVAAIVPEALDLVKDHNHEIGCHGYSHEVDRALDLLNYDEQLLEISQAKTLLESVAGTVHAFRAPALRINEDTIKVLEKTGFSSDSSICPQRFDGPFTFGSKKKLKWLISPRKPFFLNQSRSILEIPLSALFFPYIGTTMRISPTVTRMLEKYLYFESRYSEKPIVFLFHPNECLDFNGYVVPTRRTPNIFQHLFSDRIRQQLKLRRLGLAAINELDKIIVNAKSYGYEFCAIRNYRTKWK